MQRVAINHLSNGITLPEPELENPPKGRRSRGPAASGGSLSFRHPFQGRKPQIMAAMHEAFVRLAKVRSVVTLADLIGDDKGRCRPAA